MSFGRRLILFFLLLAVLPMLAVAGLLLQVTAESGTGKADARLAAGLETALRIDDEQVQGGATIAERLAKGPQLSAALRSGNPAQLKAVARRLAAQPGVTGVRIESPDGTELARAGAPEAVGFAEIELEDPSGPLGVLRVAVGTAAGFAERVAALTGREAVVVDDRGELAGSIQLPADGIPTPGETEQLDVGGVEVRARTATLRDGTNLVLLGPTEQGGLPINLRVAILLIALLAIVITYTFYLARTMHQLHDFTSQQAVTDELTGLSNQRRFRELLAKETERAKRFGHRLSLLMLDLDDFKRVNDTYGHLQGDEVLRAVAEAVRAESREVDEPSRYGGEELAVALPETDAAGAFELAERIRTRIEKVKIPLRNNAGSMGVTISIGVGELGGSVDEAEDLIAAADEALYAAKRAGKNHVHTTGAEGKVERRRRAP
ncbi:MAG: diguanylate cyclase [Solirubrobacterales bacterium]